MNLKLIKMEKLELRHLAPYLPYGLKVQYSGILNGKELSEYDKRFKEATKDDFFATFSETRPDEVIGLKVGKIRIVEVCDKFTKYRIGGRGKQTHYGAEKFKPILRPLSDLTKEIEVDGEKFVPIVELAKGSYPNENWWLTSDRAASPCHNFSFSSNSFWAYNYIADKNQTIYNQLDLFQKLFEWHFDVFGLIDKGIAIDINTINK